MSPLAQVAPGADGRVCMWSNTATAQYGVTMLGDAPGYDVSWSGADDVRPVRLAPGRRRGGIGSVRNDPTCGGGTRMASLGAVRTSRATPDGVITLIISPE